MQSHTVSLPVLHYPFPAAHHRCADSVDTRTLAWADQFNLLPSESAVRRLRAARVGWLAAVLAPTVASHTLQLLSDWTFWAILWDDLCDHPQMQQPPVQVAQWSQTLLAILCGTQAPDPESPLACSIGDLRQRLLHAATPSHVDAFIATVDAFFAGCRWEVTNRSMGHMPDVATYLPMRRHASGMATALELVMCVEPIRVPLAVRAHPQVQHLQDLAITIVCWANDLLSLPKELACGDVHNLVVILQHAEQLSLQDAVTRVAAWHDAAVCDFVAAERALPAFAPAVAAPLQRYLMLLRSFIRGNLDWSLSMSDRYHTTERIDAQDGTDQHDSPMTGYLQREVSA